MPLPAERVYLTQALLRAFASSLVFTVSALYAVLDLRLNPVQLVLIGTVLEASVFLFETPTGVVADLVSRRLSVIIGVALTGLGFVLWGAVPHFVAVLAAQALWGIGYTFTSGAQEAWLADEVGEVRAGPLYLRAAQAGQLGALVGIAASVALASLRLNLPMVVGGALYAAIAPALWLTMPESGFRPASADGSSATLRFRRTLAAAVGAARARPATLTILGSALFFGAASEAFDRLPEAHLLGRFTFPGLWNLQPVVWFGVIGAGSLVTGLAATELVRRRMATHGAAAAATLSLIIVGLMAAVLAFAFSSSLALAIGAYWVVRFLRRLHEPIVTAWLNRGLDSGVRATVISLHGQCDALGQILGGPLLGVLATAASIPTALVAVAALL
ncbi:MAG: MFS transporter, partial [Dehalococcoidia bacterium]